MLISMVLLSGWDLKGHDIMVGFDGLVMFIQYLIALNPKVVEIFKSSLKWCHIIKITKNTSYGQRKMLRLSNKDG